MKKILLIIGCLFPLSLYAEEAPYILKKDSYFQDKNGNSHPVGDLLYQGLINQPNGIAGLDSNGNISLPIYGDVSNGTYKSLSNQNVVRKINDRFNDHYNLKDLGATLDNSANDKQTIQSIYNNLPDGSVVEIPKDSAWDGTILTPDPSKHITWIFDGKLNGWYPPPSGDGDFTITYNGGFNIERRDLYTKNVGFPANFFYWNDDSNYCGAYCSNWQQNTSANFRAISGPTSSGNTSPITASMESYGQGPSSQYDVGISLNVAKYGQNSTWGLVDDMNDFSAKSPGAFSMWNEFDMWANGPDIKSWDTSYGRPQAGHRSVFFVAGRALNLPTESPWRANTNINVPSKAKGNLPQPIVVSVISSDNVNYLWYAIGSGTTGGTEPKWPVPTRFNGSLSNGVLTVTSIVSGTINVGDSITGETPVQPVIIKSQLTGDTGGLGTYSVDDNTQSAGSNSPMYSVPRVTDGSVTWQFGEEQNVTISSGIWFTGNSANVTYDTLLGSDNANISNAFIDSSVSNLKSDTKAAVIRMAQGQYIDFSGAGTLATRNNHTLDYDNWTFNFKANGNTVFKIDDSGSLFIANGFNEHGSHNITRDFNSNSSLWIYGAIPSGLSTDGSNTGGDFFFNRYSDSSAGAGGGYIDQPMSISRSTGLVTINDGANVGGVNLSNSVMTSPGSYLNEMGNALYIQDNTGSTYVDQTDANSKIGFVIRMLQKDGSAYPLGNWNGWHNDGNTFEVYTNGKIKTFGPLDVNSGAFKVNTDGTLSTSQNYFNTPSDFYLGWDIGTNSNFGLELGSGNSAGLAYIDFHTSGTGSDFDVREIASSDSTGSQLQIITDRFKTDNIYANNISLSVAEGLSSSGTTIADAKGLTASINVITNVGANSGVQLQTARIGQSVKIFNRGANSLIIYPDSTTSQIETLGAGVGFSLGVNSSVTLIKTSDTLWRVE